MGKNATEQRVSERVTTEILTRIASGHLTPGQKLPGERQLAEEMGVSRVSVRTALQGLKSQGFLDIVPGGGTRVIAVAPQIDSALAVLGKINSRALGDLAEIRCLLESWAAARAAEKATDAQIEEIAACLAAMEADTEIGREKSENDARFHLAVAQGAQSPIYLHVVEMIHDSLRQVLHYHRHQLFPTPEDDAMVLEHHRAILKAIRTRDPDRAAVAMQAHLRWVGSHYRDLSPGEDEILPD